MLTKEKTPQILKFYTYEITGECGRKYIGVRKSKVPDIFEDEYYGSYTDETFVPIKSSKRILAAFPTQQEASYDEVRRLCAVDAKNNPEYANKSNSIPLKTGREHPSYDVTVYTFYHRDGSVFEGTQNELVTKFNLFASNASSLVLGYINASGGWSLSSTAKYSSQGEIYVFYHKDGSVFKGTQADLINKFNLNHRNVSSLVLGVAKTTKGWAMHPNTKYSNQGSFYTFYHIEGVIFEGTQSDFINNFNLNPSNVSSLVQGNRKSTKGWAMQPDDKYSNCGRVYNFYHRDGRTFVGTQRGLVNQFGLKTGNVSQVALGNRKSTGGWAMQPWS